jgi:hypothetical protein
MNIPALQYEALGDILNQNITSAAAVNAGLKIPFRGFHGDGRAILTSLSTIHE